MTLIISNETNGNIESSFYENGQYIRLGKHMFFSGSIFNLLKNIADYPEARKGEIMGMDFNKYWYDNRDNILVDGDPVPFEISDDDKTVTIGDYKIDTPDFNKWAFYVIRGGNYGFGEDYQIKLGPALESLKKTNRPMLMLLQDSLFRDDL